MNIVARAAVVATRSNPTLQETPTAAESLLFGTKINYGRNAVNNLFEFDLLSKDSFYVNISVATFSHHIIHAVVNP